MNRLMTAAGALCATLVLGASAPASAHIGMTSPVAAGSHQKITFRVGHGCQGADSVRVEIEIPDTVTSLRAMPSPWGEPEITRDAAELITHVAWSKPDARDTDDLYYEFSLNITVPDAPFTVHYFKAVQTCRDSEGTETQTPWTATAEELAADPDLHPSPKMMILPKHGAGWHQFETTVEITDMRMFADAQIVWLDDAAYSANETTAAMIEADDAVEALESIPAGSSFWVKY